MKVSFKNILKTLLIGGILFGGLPVHARNDLNALLNLSDCRTCHGNTAPALASTAGGLAIVDPANNTAITKYEPGKEYAIRIGFQGQAITQADMSIAYRNAYVLTVYDISGATPVQAGQIMDNGQIGVVSGARNARIINGTVANAVNNAEVRWTAPQTGRVRITLFRNESNMNTLTTGDRVSQAAETITLTSTVTNTGPIDEDDPDANPDDEITNILPEGNQFDSSFVGGCGVISVPLKPGASWGLFILMIFGIGSLLFQRKKLRKNFR